MGVGGQREAAATLLRLRAPVPVVEEAGLAPAPVWMDMQKRIYFFPKGGGGVLSCL